MKENEIMWRNNNGNIMKIMKIVMKTNNNNENGS